MFDGNVAVGRGLTGDQALDPAALDTALAQLRDEIGERLGDTAMRFLVSSDYYPYLEYATPIGNALPDAQAANEKWIEGLDRRTLPPLVGVPDERALRRIKIMAAHRRNRCDRALRLLEGMNIAGDSSLELISQACARTVTKTDY